MKKIIEVKEYDRITGNPNYAGDPNYIYLEEPAFHGLITFIEEFTATSENNDAYDCLKIIRKRGPGEMVITKNYVGLIQLKNGYQIEILPKVSLGGTNDQENKITKATLIKMLRCMDDFQSKVFSEASIDVDRMNIYEIFIRMYIQEVDRLVVKGLKSNYVSMDDDLHFVKGKINIQKQLQQNITHKEKFYCIFDEYNLNRSENKIIKTTLIKLFEITENVENKRSINRLLSCFELVDVSFNYDIDFAKISNDRFMNDYRLLMKWSKVFLKNKSFTSFSGDTVSRALLFPMDRLFEAYVAKKMKEIYSRDNYRVVTQDRGYYLFNIPANKFAIRPDIVVTKIDESIVVMDTKWKVLNNNSRENYGISQSDMYQMYVYARKYEKDNGYKIPDVWLLYPTTDGVSGCSNISFRSDEGVNVHVFFVDVTDISNSLLELKSFI